MSVVIVCPSCGASLKAPEGARGRVLACPKCSGKVRVPLQARARAARDATEPGSDDLELAVLPSSYIRDNLMPGERLLAVTRVHPAVLLVPGLVLIFCLGFYGFAVVIALRDGYPAVPFCIAPFLLLGVALFLHFLIIWLTTEFCLTDKRILIKRGLLGTYLRETSLAKVESLRVDKGILGRLLGYGTVVIRGTGAGRRYCQHIEKLLTFYKRIQEAVAAAQKV